MKILVVDDDFTSRLLLQELLRPYGAVHIAVNGKEAVQAFQMAHDAGQPYSLVCLDIMMPEMDGQAVLQAVRQMEEAKGIFSTDGAKIIMTTALGNLSSVMASYQNLCDAYLVKPIDKTKLLSQLASLGFAV